jgi:enamine deaminase RidA (YjgF/YER057c/UK114 family)
LDSGLNAHTQLLPTGWPRPKGYSNGVLVRGGSIFVGGQIGWDETGRFPPTLVEQIGQTLRNIVAVLGEGGATPADVVRLTWYVLDIEAYSEQAKEIGRVYREVMGANYPPMSLVQVVRLVEKDALVEIEATAVLAS